MYAYEIYILNYEEFLVDLLYPYKIYRQNNNFENLTYVTVLFTLHYVQILVTLSHL